jgi:hypothetical protein
MNRLNDLICEAWKDHLLSDQPWYKRKSVWLMATALVVPFGWVIPVAHVAWVRAKRSRRF